MDRVADFESVGWGFESLVPRQNPGNPLVGFFGFLITKNACTIRFQITCMRLMVHFDFVRLLLLNDRDFFHHLWCERLVGSVSVLVYDAVSYVHTFDDLSERCVLTVEMRCVFHHDKELRTC